MNCLGKKSLETWLLVAEGILSPQYKRVTPKRIVNFPIIFQNDEETSSNQQNDETNATAVTKTITDAKTITGID